MAITIQVETEDGIQMPEMADFGSVERARAPLPTPSLSGAAGAEVTPNVAVAGKQKQIKNTGRLHALYLLQPYRAKP